MVKAITPEDIRQAVSLSRAYHEAMVNAVNAVTALTPDGTFTENAKAARLAASKSFIFAQCQLREETPENQQSFAADLGRAIDDVLRRYCAPRRPPPSP